MVYRGTGRVLERLRKQTEMRIFASTNPSRQLAPRFHVPCTARTALRPIYSSMLLLLTSPPRKLDSINCNMKKWNYNNPNIRFSAEFLLCILFHLLNIHKTKNWNQLNTRWYSEEPAERARCLFCGALNWQLPWRRKFHLGNGQGVFLSHGRTHTQHTHTWSCLWTKVILGRHTMQHIMKKRHEQHYVNTEHM